jgi:precorrin-6B methylase 2
MEKKGKIQINLINVGEDLQKNVLEEFWTSLKNEVNIITTKCTKEIKIVTFQTQFKKIWKEKLVIAQLNKWEATKNWQNHL